MHNLCVKLVTNYSSCSSFVDSKVEIPCSVRATRVKELEAISIRADS